MVKLEKQHPGAFTELNFRNPFELLVATILSAQCTDKRVNQVTRDLFQVYPDASTMADALPDTLERLIKATGFFRAKSRSLIGAASVLVNQHNGNIPPLMDDLVKLPGVGRKTANVVLGHALGVPGFPVDRHVLRVANRLGIVQSNDPKVVETDLCTVIPPARWIVSSDTLIFHGRRVCKPYPECDHCWVRDECNFVKSPVSIHPLPRRSRAATTRKRAAPARSQCKQ